MCQESLHQSPPTASLSPSPPSPPPRHTVSPLHLQLAVFWVAEPSLPLRFFTTSGKVNVDGRECVMTWSCNSISACVSRRTTCLLSTPRTSGSLGLQLSRSFSQKVRSYVPLNDCDIKAVAMMCIESTTMLPVCVLWGTLPQVTWKLQP